MISKISKFIRPLAFVASVVFAVVFAPKAHAEYLDSWNLYNGEFAAKMWVDPSGMSPRFGSCNGVQYDIQYYECRNGHVQPITPRPDDPTSNSPEKYGGSNQTISIETVFGPEPGYCGASAWAVIFHLSEPSHAGGYLVQEIKTDIAVYSVGGQQSVSEHYHFWEAWRVLPEGTTAHDDVSGDINGIDYTDVYMTPEQRECTTGAITVEGKVKFYEGLQSLPPEFAPGNAPAGDLPATISDPQFGGGSNPVTHSISLTWDCVTASIGERRRKLTNIGSHTP